MTLSEIEQIKRTLDESSIVSITDRNGTITYVNKMFCEVSKYSAGELIGQNHRILKSGHHPPEFFQGMWKNISSGQIWKGMVKNKAKDGTFYWVKTVIVPFTDENGMIIKYVSIRTDITEQLELKDKLVRSEKRIESEKLAVIGELSARIAHDLRNPLSVIKNGIQIIKERDIHMDEKTVLVLQRIDRAVGRMTHQIDEVLDFVKPRPLNIEKKSLLTILHSTLDGFVKPDTVKINLPQNDVQIKCDATKLEIVFSNIMLNAIQAMGSLGQIDITIADKKEQVIIEIQDNGPGIPSYILPKIFDPLFTTKQMGTGLGLPSCKSIVEKHGGKIEVKTVLGKSTTFIITLPKIL